MKKISLFIMTLITTILVIAPNVLAEEAQMTEDEAAVYKTMQALMYLVFGGIVIAILIVVYKKVKQNKVNKEKYEEELRKTKENRK